MEQVSKSTNLTCMWRVEKKRENGIKEGGAIKIENEESREKHRSNQELTL